MPKARIEIQLLLACARTHMDAAHADRVRSLLGAEIDWNDLLQLAVAHGVLALVHNSLQSCGSDLVPENVLSHLSASFKMNARRNFVRTQELLRLLRLFQEQGIPVVSLKGPILASSAYGNLAYRAFCDLDLLVRERDVWRARDLIVTQGYRQAVEMTKAEEARYVRKERELALRNEKGQVQVDLQWSIPADWLALRTFPLDPERLLERLEPLSLGGVSTRWFTPEDLLLVLCVHGASHGWRELKLTCDVAQVIQHYPQLDWEQVLAQAEGWGVRRMLYLGLRLAHDLLDARLPVEVEALVLADHVVGSLALQAYEWFWLFGGPEGPAHLFDEASFYIRLRERRAEKLAYRLFYLWAYLRPQLVPTDEDRARLALPKPLAFLHYAIKPVQMVAKYGLRSVRRVLRILYDPRLT